MLLVRISTPQENFEPLLFVWKDKELLHVYVATIADLFILKGHFGKPHNKFVGFKRNDPGYSEWSVDPSKFEEIRAEYLQYRTKVK